MFVMVKQWLKFNLSQNPQIQGKVMEMRKHLKQAVSHWSIARKISYGYTLTIGIAVTGTGIGFIVGDYYQKKAALKLDITHEQQYLLKDLENSIQAMRLHPQRLVTVLGDSIWFEYETAAFNAQVSRTQQLFNQLDIFSRDYPEYLPIAQQDFNDLLNDYSKTTTGYETMIKSMWQQIQPAFLKKSEISPAETDIWGTMRQKGVIQINVKFDRLSEHLTTIIAKAKIQQRQAETELQQAQTLRFQIIVTSMLLSVLIAGILASYTSQVIAQPIEHLTEVANQITQDSDFSLEVPITTEDEVGKLGISFNQLIHWVGEYTHALEVARQTLEDRVEERTQALKEALQNLQSTQTRLIQTEKMSSLGQMVAGIAHEINNPVSFIYGNIESAKDYINLLINLINLYQQEHPHPSSELQDYMEMMELEFIIEDLPKILDSMKTGADRIRHIVVSLRNFSRLDESEQKMVNLHDGLNNTLLILNNRFEQVGIEVILDYAEIPLIECYPAQLNQVFMNILMNAIDALESHKKQMLDIETPRIVVKTETLFPNSTHIQVSITDNGPGIPEEIQNQVFDPFFTTKEIGKGTGLGLAIAYQVVEKHGGNIEVKSALGTGATFSIVLPVGVGVPGVERVGMRKR